MKTFVLVLVAVLFIFTGVAQAVDISAEARFGYAIDSNVDNNVASLEFDPNYVFEGLIKAKVTDNVTLRLGLDNAQSVSIDYSYGIDYTISGPFGVFIEHTDHDMKGGLPDYDVTWAGVVLKIE